ncbi:MAG: hypothetical protein AAFX57_08945 [Bacteroidota bacterium]
MRSNFTVLVVLSVLFVGCATEKQEKPVSKDALLGTWRLIKYIDHANGGSEWISYSDDFIYEKHVTPTDF